MQSYNKCNNCNGKKKVLGLGGIVKNCSECQGVGYTKAKETCNKKRKNSDLEKD